jgi:predicted nucleic acid-binding protein
MDVRFCPVFTDSFLENMRTVLGEWYDNQMDMKPRPYTGSILDVGFSHDRNIVEMTMADFERLKADNMITQICDPSYSAKNKKQGDNKSRFTILSAVVSEERYYLYGGYQCLGVDISGVKARNIEIATRENIDFFIQDAQGSQQNYYEEQIAAMKKELPALMDFKHTLRIRGAGGSGKENAANSVLKDLMLTGDIVVVKIIDDPDEDRKKMIKEIISQLTGLSGMDFVDCTVYMVADVDRMYDIDTARLNKRRKNNGRHTKLINLTGGHKKFGRLA